MLLAENLLQLIRGRRSVSPRKLSAPGPSDEQLSQMAAIIAAVPDHGRLSPARLVHIADRQALADLFVDALKELEPVADETALARERERAGHAPCLLALIVRIDEANATAPPHEQWISAGASLQNVLLFAEALGFRTKILSGRKTTSKTLRSAFDLGPSEVLVGFIAVGSDLGGARAVGEET